MPLSILWYGKLLHSRWLVLPGILIEKLDTKKFIESIALLAKNKNLQKKLKKNCRQTILKRYSVQNEVKKYIQIYEKIINEKD